MRPHPPTPVRRDSNRGHAVISAVWHASSNLVATVESEPPLLARTPSTLVIRDHEGQVRWRREYPSRLTNVFWSLDGQVIASTGNNRIEVLNGQTGSVDRTISLPFEATILRLAPDNKRLLAAGMNVVEVDSQTGKISTLDSSYENIIDASWQADGIFLLTRSTVERDNIYDEETRRRVALRKVGSLDPVFEMVIDCDLHKGFPSYGILSVAPTCDSIVYVQKESGFLWEHGRKTDFSGVRFEPRYGNIWNSDSSAFAFMGPGAVFIVSGEESNVVRELKIPHFVYSIAWSPDNKSLAIVHRGGLSVFSPEVGLRSITTQPWNGYSACSWSPCGRAVATQGEVISIPQ